MKSNIAVVGCGYWGKNFVRNFYELDSLYCICEPNQEIAQQFTESLDVKNYTFEQILNDANIQGVVLAVPAEHHSKLALDVMSSKKHVFVEKPLAMNINEAHTMIDSSKKNGVNLMVGHLLHYHPAFIEAKKLCVNGKIGKIKQIISNRMSLGKIRSEEDVLWSFAPHDISMILSLIKEKIELIHATGNQILQDDISDIAHVEILFKDGSQARVSVSWLHPFKEQKLTIIGESGMIVFDDTNDWDTKLSIVDFIIDKSSKNIKATRNNKYISIKETEPLKEECKHFINLINNKVDNITDGYEGLNVLKVLKSATDSLKKKERIYIN